MVGDIEVVLLGDPLIAALEPLLRYWRQNVRTLRKNQPTGSMRGFGYLRTISWRTCGGTGIVNVVGRKKGSVTVTNCGFV